MCKSRREWCTLAHRSPSPSHSRTRKRWDCGVRCTRCTDSITPHTTHFQPPGNCFFFIFISLAGGRKLPEYYGKGKTGPPTEYDGTVSSGTVGSERMQQSSATVVLPFRMQGVAHLHLSGRDDSGHAHSDSRCRWWNDVLGRHSQRHDRNGAFWCLNDDDPWTSRQ